MIISRSETLKFAELFASAVALLYTKRYLLNAHSYSSDVPYPVGFVRFFEEGQNKTPRK